MLELLTDITCGIVMSSGGAGVGWLLHRALRGTAVEATDEQKIAKEVLNRLKDLAGDMAAGVGQHSDRVEEINQELTAREPQGPECVISAVARLIESNQSMQWQLGEVEDKLHEQARLVEKKSAEARTDVLTGLANRRAFDDQLAACREEYEQSRRTFSLILGDIDHFKKFNDTHGHQTGDEVLRGTARVLRKTARNTDFVARYGGEEMAIVLSGTRGEEAVCALERARQAVEKARFCEGKGGNPRLCDDHESTPPAKGTPATGTVPILPTQELGQPPLCCTNVTMSFGVAEIQPGEDQKALIGRADAALYASKEAGRNRGCWHDGEKIRPIARPCDVAEAEAATATASTASGKGDSPHLPERPGGGHRRAAVVVAQMGTVPFSAAPPPAAPAPSAPAPSDVGQKPEGDVRICDKSEFGLSLGRRLAEWRRRGAAPTLLLMQIDDFANLSQRHGQAAAEVVLKSATQFLTASIRSMDLGSEYGPATFAVLLPGASSTELIRVAERLRQAVARCSLPIGGQSVRFTVSLAAAAAIQTDSTEQMLARAEAALEQAAAAGGNRTYFHSGDKAEPANVTMERIRTAAAV